MVFLEPNKGNYERLMPYLPHQCEGQRLSATHGGGGGGRGGGGG